jgi:hypothetical protein
MHTETGELGCRHRTPSALAVDDKDSSRIDMGKRPKLNGAR